MKNRKFLLLAFALAIFTATVPYLQGDNTLILTDQEMDAVVGGLECYYCGSNGDGCEPGWITGNCDYEKDGECDGAAQSSCKEAQQKCKPGGTGTCSNSSNDCNGVYYTFTCEEKTSEQEGETVHECYWQKEQSLPLECSGYRTDC
jgi:hypothetical protein